MSQHEQRQRERKRPRKVRLGFWCPSEIDDVLTQLVLAGTHEDRSKAVVALLRKAIADDNLLPPELEGKVRGVSAALQRCREAVVVQCVSGMMEYIDSEGAVVPMIFEEIRLRKRHLQNDMPRLTAP
jgi:hypothetical protein